MMVASLVGAFCLGLVVGVLIGVAAVWDKRFAAGRRHGYDQGREWGLDQNEMNRIRSMM